MVSNMVVKQESDREIGQLHRAKLLGSNIKQNDVPSVRYTRSKNEDSTLFKSSMMGKGGMYTDNDYEMDTQINLTNISTVREEWVDWSDGTDPIEVEVKQDNDNSTTVYEKEWRFIHTLSPSIRVDEDDNGSLLFRRGDHGILITKEELFKCINMVI